tara:strand:- start:55 stop:738 length:684 start_codon:yes stop_codon:yes gene_type:complete
MNSKPQKIIINIEEDKYLNWKIYLKNEFKKISSRNIEIDCKDLELCCRDILELSAIANQYDCRIVSFCSTSKKTIVSSQSLGYVSHFIFEDHLNNPLKVNRKYSNSSKTDFHQGTVRSGEYIESSGDLLILGDVNPGALVSAEGNIIIWGRLLGIAHAGSTGNYKATISSLQLKPVQLRIANKIARGPKEEPQLGIAEQARIDSGEIIIAPIEGNELKNSNPHEFEN